MSAPVQAQAVILRSLRYGEADRILHLYTLELGRISAIAKGARRQRSKLGGRLEPLTHSTVMLRRGRGELYTVTGADTIAAYRRLREDRVALDMAGRACDAVGRLFADGEPQPAAFHLLVNELGLLEGDVARATHANQLAFRTKLLLAAGLTPHLTSCASCGESDHLSGFSPKAGGVVCSSCEAGAFAFSAAAHDFLTDVLARPLAEAPEADGVTLTQVERALHATAEHHGGLQLRDAAPPVRTQPPPRMPAVAPSHAAARITPDG